VETSQGNRIAGLHKDVALFRPAVPGCDVVLGNRLPKGVRRFLRVRPSLDAGKKAFGSYVEGFELLLAFLSTFSKF
jgi:hypothetical protein